MDKELLFILTQKFQREYKRKFDLIQMGIQDHDSKVQVIETRMLVIIAQMRDFLNSNHEIKTQREIVLYLDRYMKKLQTQTREVAEAQFVGLSPEQRVMAIEVMDQILIQIVEELL